MKSFSVTNDEIRFVKAAKERERERETAEEQETPVARCSFNKK